jgi:FkbM family methyltransferase
VIIPCFNARNWILDALRSVVDQRLPRLETIVVDDGSVDGSAELVAREFPDVVLVRGEHRGPSAARNLGTSLSTGEYIQYLDADDVLAPGKLEVQLQALADHRADVAYGDWKELTSAVVGQGRLIQRRMEGEPEIALFTDFWCPPAAYLFRRDIVEQVGGWKEELPVIQDARFALDCALFGGMFVYCPGVAAYYRVHTGGSVSTRDPIAFTRDCLHNACSVERWWNAHGGTDGRRRTALIRVYSQVARASFDADRPAFEVAYAALERLQPGFLPRQPRSLHMLARVTGYRRAEAVASRYRRAKRHLLTFAGYASGLSRRHLLGPSVKLSSEGIPAPRESRRCTPVQAGHARLRCVAGWAYRVPGVTRVARAALRTLLRHGGVSRGIKQRLHNFFAVDVSPPGPATCAVNVPGARALELRLHVRDDLTRYWYFWGYAHYELGTTRLLRRLLRRRRVFFDVGANVGYHTFLAASLLEAERGGAVHAFEPWSAVFDDLAASARLNRFNCLDLNQVALSDRDGMQQLFSPGPAEWTTASLVPDLARQPCERVPVMRFDSYCRRRGVERVDLIKIDVEGAELHVLRGMGGLLANWQPDIILEVLEPFAAEIDGFFAETPYRKFRIRDTGLEELQRISATPHDRNIFLSCEPELALP